MSVPSRRSASGPLFFMPIVILFAMLFDTGVLPCSAAIEEPPDLSQNTEDVPAQLDLLDAFREELRIPPAGACTGSSCSSPSVNLMQKEAELRHQTGRSQKPRIETALAAFKTANLLATNRSRSRESQLQISAFSVANNSNSELGQRGESGSLSVEEKLAHISQRVSLETHSAKGAHQERSNTSRVSADHSDASAESSTVDIVASTMREVSARLEQSEQNSGLPKVHRGERQTPLEHASDVLAPTFMQLDLATELEGNATHANKSAQLPIGIVNMPMLNLTNTTLGVVHSPAAATVNATLGEVHSAAAAVPNPSEPEVKAKMGEVHLPARNETRTRNVSDANDTLPGAYAITEGLIAEGLHQNEAIVAMPSASTVDKAVNARANAQWSETLDPRNWVRLLTPRGFAIAVVVGLAMATLTVLLGLAVVLLFRALNVTERLRASAIWQRSSNVAIRAHVVSLPVCLSEDVEYRFPAAGGYDCNLSRPLSSRQSLRLEARVEGLVSGNALVAPFSQRECVHYSARVSQQTRDGAHSLPVAFGSESRSFRVSVKGASRVIVEISGEDLMLFDMNAGKHTGWQMSFAAAPEHWQDFALFHRTALPSSDFSGAFEFQETALLVGSEITLVGELMREANGKMSLIPWRSKADKKKDKTLQLQDSWRTSWERGVVMPPMVTRSKPEMVFVSDDPLLLGGSSAGNEEAADSKNDRLSGVIQSVAAAFTAVAKKTTALAHGLRKTPQDDIVEDSKLPPPCSLNV